ncbi:uncharacterized protein BDV14DRAFT_151770 [Aspergillus stella-maris]|uniref:uncharacterized protein n=1 Tax=Aspergillus stella-maris TaxID=1810926 RepID=UPI003CCDAA75
MPGYMGVLGRRSSPGEGRGQLGPGRLSYRSPRVSAPTAGKILTTISKTDIEASIHTSLPEKESPKIAGCKLVGSYNWLNRKSPTILVPGEPPKWTPVSSPGKLPEDNDSYFRDQNAARYAEHVFQPAMEAILKQNASFDFTDVDIIACGSTIGNLRRFVTEPDKAFRIVVEAIGSAVFFVRRENSPTQTIPNVRGYGHTFPEANTTWGSDVKGSESHQRILQYKFAGLSCLVRYEGDGYFSTVKQLLKDADNSEAGTPDDLLKSFNNASVSTFAPINKRPLNVQTGGETIPQSTMFDLKTRSNSKEYSDVLRSELPRLWIAQIPNFIVAFHKWGVFHDIRVNDVRDDVRKWEDEHQSDLGKLAALLRMLVAFAHSQPDGRFEVVFEGGPYNQLELREVRGQVNCCISEAMKNRCVEGASALGEDKSDGEEEEEEREEEEFRREEDWSSEEDFGSVKDFTACSAEDCGYCGHCGY